MHSSYKHKSVVLSDGYTQGTFRDRSVTHAGGAGGLRRGGLILFTTFGGGGAKIRRGFSRGGSIFSQKFFELFLKRMHLIAFKITLQGILNTFIFW